MKDKNVSNDNYIEDNGDRCLVEQLHQTTRGLLCKSESDYPFRIIYWDDVDNLNAAALLQKCNLDLSTNIATQTVKSFFARATQEQDWHQAVEKAEVKRYQNLVNLLKEHLQDLQVYRIGEIEIDIYVLGKTASGAIAGLSTKVVET